MKLRIPSKVAQDIREIIRSNLHGLNFCFRVGSVTRNGFIPELSNWQQKNIREGIEALGVNERVSVSSIFVESCTIGNVRGHDLIFGHVSATKVKKSCTHRCYDITDTLGMGCCIKFIDSTIQIEINGDVKDLTTLFTPIKFIYGLMKPLLSPVIGEKPILPLEKHVQIDILNSQKTPDNDWVIAPYLSTGEWGTLWIYKDQMYIFLNNVIHSINTRVNEPFHNKIYNELSIFHGYWINENFIICLPITIAGKDVKNRNISHRLALAKRATLGLDYCSVAKIFDTSKKTQEFIINRYGGVIYLPRNLGPSPCVYIPVYKISLFFKVTRKFSSGLPFFELNDSNGIFTGSKDFPYHTPISMSREDRELLNKFPTPSIMEFRWENDNLVPYARSRQISLSCCNYYTWNLLHHVKVLFKNTESSPKAPMIANQRKPLKMLPVNKSVVFYSPVEGEDVLVRTGTIGEGSCLFHALLHAYSKDYAMMDRKGRMKFVIRLRASMAGKVNPQSWEEMGGGVISKVPFQENAREILDNFYRFVQSNGKNKVHGRSSRRVIKKLVNDGELSEVYNLLTELVPFNILTSTCLPRGYDRSQDDRIDQTSLTVCDEVVKHLRSLKEIKQLNDQKAAYIEKKMNDLLYIVLKESKDAAYRSYIKGLERVSAAVDSYTIEFISDRFNRDVYFLDATTRLPYNTCPTSSNLKGRKSMIVLWVGGNHYEIVGRLLPGNRIQREFPADDELINRIRTFMTKPETIKDLYPDLVEYLPSSYRSDSPRRRSVRMNTTNDDEDEDSDSDRYYDSSDEELDSVLSTNSN